MKHRPKTRQERDDLALAVAARGRTRPGRHRAPRSNIEDRPVPVPSRRRTITAVAIIAAAAVGGAVATQVANATGWLTDAVPATDTVVSGCVIRFSAPDGSPSIHANAAHQCAGVTSVGITSAGRLRVAQTVTDPAAHPILFAFTQADETLSARGISCGASGGTGDTEYVCYDARLGRALDLSDPDDRARMQGKYSNLWVGFVHGGAR